MEFRHLAERSEGAEAPLEKRNSTPAKLQTEAFMQRVRMASLPCQYK